MDSLLSISAGIMLAASFFSLLEPAVEVAKTLYRFHWIVVFSGFIIGGILLFFGDKIMESMFSKKNLEISRLKRCIMLFSSITLHNIPEGLVLGVAYGAVAANIHSTSLFSALSLTLAIAIQNFPEGSAISLPLRREGFSRARSFLFGSLSGLVEPIAAVLGAILVIKIQYILPFILSFAAGAMIFVTTMELIPESQNNNKKSLMALFLMIGFSIMMILELIFG